MERGGTGRQAQVLQARRPPRSVDPAGTSSTTRPCWAVVRTRPPPTDSASAASLGQGASAGAPGRRWWHRRRTCRRPGRSRRCGRGGPARRPAAVRPAACARGTPPAAPRETSRCPSRPAGTSAGRGCASAGSRSRGRCRPRRPTPRPPRPGGRTPRAAGRTSGWWTTRRRPTGRSPARRRRRCTPTKATSLISWLTQCWAQPEIEVLNLRGRLEKAGSPRYRSTVSASAAEASATASAATPSSGQLSITRGVSPQASVVLSPTASSCSQMVGTSSIRIQCSWMFCRSVMSATSRPYRVAMSPTTRSCSRGQPPAVDADAEHEVAIFELFGLQDRRPAARDALGALGVEAVPAEPAAQVTGIDAVEAGVLVDVDDPLLDQQTVVVSFAALVGVQRFAVAQRPLTLSLARCHCQLHPFEIAPSGHESVKG